MDRVTVRDLERVLSRAGLSLAEGLYRLGWFILVAGLIQVVVLGLILVALLLIR